MTPPEIFGRVRARPRRQALSDSCFPYGHCPRVGQSAEPGAATDQQRRRQSAPDASLRQRPFMAQDRRSQAITISRLVRKGRGLINLRLVREWKQRQKPILFASSGGLLYHAALEGATVSRRKASSARRRRIDRSKPCIPVCHCRSTICSRLLRVCAIP